MIALLLTSTHLGCTTTQTDDMLVKNKVIASRQGKKLHKKAPKSTATKNQIMEAQKKGLPVYFDQNVDRWIDYFANKNHNFFQNALDQGEPYRKTIVGLLRERGVPAELYYIPLIESGFDNAAKSNPGSAGIWQLTEEAGRRYGLRIDGEVDERLDPERASIAAARYLSDLHNVFTSWYLTAAAYDAGEIRILNAIMRGKTRDFWRLSEAGLIPSQTTEYIPKLMAAIIIGSAPEKYGFRRPVPKTLKDLVASLEP
jgi:membrane-bound lytic murein transglycosylase D